MLVCHCKVVSDQAIRAAVRAGARDLAGIAGTCGAGDACGGCVPGIEDLLAEASLAIEDPDRVGALQAARRLAEPPRRIGQVPPDRFDEVAVA